MCGLLQFWWEGGAEQLLLLLLLLVGWVDCMARFVKEQGWYIFACIDMGSWIAEVD